jgi:ribosomal protein S18 acetylase RimI-like enzyme
VYAVSEMVWEVFCEFEAPDFSDKGINTFKEFIDPENLLAHIKENNFKICCCFDRDLLVGVLALREITHISLLFVRKSHHRRGIAKKLLEMAIEDIFELNPAAQELTVNSSPYAVEIYKKFGFISTDVMQEKDGLTFMPMKKCLKGSL